MIEDIIPGVARKVQEILSDTQNIMVPDLQRQYRRRFHHRSPKKSILRRQDSTAACSGGWQDPEGAFQGGGLLDQSCLRFHNDGCDQG